MPAQIIADK